VESRFLNINSVSPRDDSSQDPEVSFSSILIMTVVLDKKPYFL